MKTKVKLLRMSKWRMEKLVLDHKKKIRDKEKQIEFLTSELNSEKTRARKSSKKFRESLKKGKLLLKLRKTKNLVNQNDKKKLSKCKKAKKRLKNREKANRQKLREKEKELKTLRLKLKKFGHKSTTREDETCLKVKFS